MSRRLLVVYIVEEVLRKRRYVSIYIDVDVHSLI